MRPGTAALALMLPIAQGCGAGHVKIDAVDHFGTPHSAVWLDLSLTTDVGAQHWHELVLSTEGNLCGEFTREFPALGLAWSDYNAVILAFPEDTDQQCAAAIDYWTALAEITEPWFKRGMNDVHVTLRDPTEAEDVPPTAGTYGANYDFQTEAPYFEARVHTWTENPYALFRDQVACDKPWWMAEAQDELVAIHDEWSASDGSAEVTARGDDKLHVDLEATLVNTDGDTDGLLELRGTFKRCTIAWNGAFDMLL